jgi:hypothetical protein
MIPMKDLEILRALANKEDLEKDGILSWKEMEKRLGIAGD